MGICRFKNGNSALLHIESGWDFPSVTEEHCGGGRKEDFFSSRFSACTLCFWDALLSHHAD